MRGELDKGGRLFIQRRQRILMQYCPYNSDGESACSHFCPHFGEPEEKKENRNGATLKTILRLCNGTVLSFEGFIDRREA